MEFVATKAGVDNRGNPPNSFLIQLVRWGRNISEELFAPNPFNDIYSSVKKELGPWKDNHHRKAVMLEVMRVLGGFESSWDWNEGRDTTNSTSVTDQTIEAGLWQVSANSLNFGIELKDLVMLHVGTLNAIKFQAAMKQDHALAMEYVARLLRRTTAHHGPVLRKEIHEWLSREAVDEFEGLTS